MDLQSYLTSKFLTWSPSIPEVTETTKCTIKLKWNAGPFDFISDQLIYRLEKREKIPPWVVVYSGGKQTRLVDNLPPRHPQKFRLRIILKATSVAKLAEKAIEAFGIEDKVYECFENYERLKLSKGDSVNSSSSKGESTRSDANESATVPISSDLNKTGDDVSKENVDEKTSNDGINNEKTSNDGIINEKTSNDGINNEKDRIDDSSDSKCDRIREQSRPWLETLWSEETWTSTDTDGTSATCFCMAVKCGYIKQVQVMLDERPELIGIINSKNGFTPLGTAVRKGDLPTVKFLLQAGADINQRCTTQQTPLHLAILAGYAPVAVLLLDRGADTEARDLNGLRWEHYAVDSGRLDMLQLVFGRGGDVHVTDDNGWTPLFRAICQGARTELILDLVERGSDVTAADLAGLPLTSAARLLKNRQGRNRDSILRLVDSQYPHEKALEHFTRLTKKISSVHSVFK